MKREAASVLISGHCYDDFPVDHDGEEADSLLSAWTSLWHPAVLTSIRNVPNWIRIDDLHDSLEGHIFVVPSPTQSEIHEEFVERAKRDGAILCRESQTREQVLNTLLPQLLETDVPLVEASLAAEFFALGYCYLQIELLTRHMRYTSGVSESDFHVSLMAAAEAAVSTEDLDAKLTKVDEHLRECYDHLTQEREHYYAVEVYLLDFALWAEQLPTSGLEQQLKSPAPFSFLFPASAVAKIPDELLSTIRESIEKGNLSLIGGEFRELPLPLLSGETILRELQHGQQVFDDRFGRRTTSYGRRTFGLTPILPQILGKLDYNGVLHATFDDGKFPEANQTRSRWEGHEGSCLEAIVRAPLDATRSQTFLNLAGNISNSMDMDHVATKCLIHWAGETNQWFDELRRISKFTNALGRFVTAEEYFQEPFHAGMQERFKFDDYRSPYLEQAIRRNDPNPISAHVRYWQRQIRWQQVEALGVVAALVGSTNWANQYEQVAKLQTKRQELLSQVNAEFDAELAQTYDDLANGLSDRLLQASVNGENEQSAQSGVFAFNGFSFPVRQYCEPKSLSKMPVVEKPVYATNEKGTAALAFDLPAMGFAWVTSGGASSKPNRGSDTLIAEDNFLRNEFFEAEIDPKSGGLRLVRDYKSRSSRLSQQLAFRLKASLPRDSEDTKFSSLYTKMVADELTIIRSDSFVGQIRTQGRLLDGDDVVARFTQTYSARRGSRVLKLETELETLREPNDQPWRSYFGHRFAWPNEAASLIASTNDYGIHNESRRLEAPRFIEIDDATRRTSILCGGLPFHTRVGHRMLDSLLVARGETCRKFTIGIGIDLRNPFRQAQEILGYEKVIERLGPKETSTGWFFHLDAKNVIATSWEPIFRNELSTEQSSAESDDGVNLASTDGPNVESEDPTNKQVVGVRLRLVETERKTTKVTLATFREVVSARKTNFLGETADQCSIDANRVTMTVRGHEWAQVEILFESVVAGESGS